MTRDEALIKSIEQEYITEFEFVNLEADLRGLINKIYDDFENNLSSINRVEVVGKNGREFSKHLKDGKYTISLQDNNKTIKLFEN
jgi:hypothetical protein